jgi:hypothetical protein
MWLLPEGLVVRVAWITGIRPALVRIRPLGRIRVLGGVVQRVMRIEVV